MKTRFFILGMTLLSYGVNFSIAQTKTISYQELPTASGNPTGSGMFLGASMTSASITITFSGPSDRWIALGFGSFMDPTDVLIYSGGKTGATHTVDWFDYYNSATNAAGVNIDATQNWSITSNTVASGVRTVVATRTLSTGDPNDVAILYNAANLNVVWARGASASYTISNHGTTNRASGITLPWSIPDVTAPTLAATSALSPTDNSTGVAVSSNLTATFSENIQAGTGLIEVFLSSGTLVEAYDVTNSANLSFSGATVTINPTNNLLNLTDYYITIGPTAINDLAGNAFTGISDNSTWNFTTALDASSSLEDLMQTNIVRVQDKNVLILFDGAKELLVKIYDAQGKMLSESVNQKIIDLSKEKNGIYLLSIVVDGQPFQTRILLN
jgi:hypothetical protein